ncbi:MAG TPA: N-acetyltransferase [Phycisphaerae bacterium]|nr:N-acetyltransferase [Phycisphaerae bacterium]
MKTRHAKIQDAAAVCELINYYAERGLMLHRSMESFYDSLREFIVAVDDEGRIVGCAAIDVMWSDLAEVKSLAVAPDMRRGGIGSEMIKAALADARTIGVKKLFSLTYEQRFFERHGFSVIDREQLPEKVWRECIACDKVDACDEIAMWCLLDEQ